MTLFTLTHRHFDKVLVDPTYGDDYHQEGDQTHYRKKKTDADEPSKCKGDE